MSKFNTITYRNWIIQSIGGNEDIFWISVFLIDEYSRLFGENVMYNETCIIYNEPHSECPMLITSICPLMIRLSQENTSCCAQTIYQLSHELCHYAIRQAKINKEFTLSWFEEIVCEAMALYALEYSYKNWHKCYMGSLFPTFNLSIKDYLENELSKNGNDGFSSSDTLVKLKLYETKRLSENDRESHRNERNQLYKLISLHPERIKCVLDYQKYLNRDTNVTIDFNKWMQNLDNQMVIELKKIQPIKESK